MKICVIGAGYVGLVTAACLADMGNTVICLDVDHSRVDMLNRGEVPIHEPGLDNLLHRNAAAGRLKFTTDVEAAVTQGTIIFIAVGTPAAEDGSADLDFMKMWEGSIAVCLAPPELLAKAIRVVERMKQSMRPTARFTQIVQQDAMKMAACGMMASVSQEQGAGMAAHR